MQHSVSCLNKFTPVSQVWRDTVWRSCAVFHSHQTVVRPLRCYASGHNQHHQLFCDFWNCDIRVQHYILQHNLALLLYWGYTGCQWLLESVLILSLFSTILVFSLSSLHLSPSGLQVTVVLCLQAAPSVNHTDSISVLTMELRSVNLVLQC